jgi:hypothetical protein
MARPSHQRQAIAAAAARLMAEDGVEDFGLAKRKAAKQLGVFETQALPRNEEIEDELRRYQNLYQRDEQTERLSELRHLAITIMRDLAEFHPHLTGQVLSGTAGRYGGIHLMMFTDDAKALELLLLSRDIAYKTGQKSFNVGDRAVNVPNMEIDWHGTPILITLFGAKDERTAIRTGPNGRPIERAALPALLDLMRSTLNSSDNPAHE